MTRSEDGDDWTGWEWKYTDEDTWRNSDGAPVIDSDSLLQANARIAQLQNEVAQLQQQRSLWTSSSGQ